MWQFTEDCLGPSATSLPYIFGSSGPEKFALVNESSGHSQNKRTRDIYIYFWKVMEAIIWYWNWKGKSQWRCSWLLTSVGVWGFLQGWLPTAFHYSVLTLWPVACIGEVVAGYYLEWEKVIMEQKDTSEPDMSMLECPHWGPGAVASLLVASLTFCIELDVLMLTWSLRPLVTLS